MSDEKRWYIIHVQTMQEDKVKAHMERVVAQKGLQEKIVQIVVPTEDVIEVRRNKKYIKKRKFFPGYVLIQMLIDNETFWVIKNAPAVTGFLGGLKPTPLSDDDALRLMTAMTAPQSAKPKPAITFERDENVRIMEGPFANFVGVVDEVHEEKAKLRVMVTIFGRATPIEVDFLQVEKI